MKGRELIILFGFSLPFHSNLSANQASGTVYMEDKTRVKYRPCSQRPSNLVGVGNLNRKKIGT